mmetsp:Transcript_17599/g.57508  ORF Transcript_17599/g.57508 Transcript_17599/m.57508 type:complete len:289 (+) Transcript_17599:565-1431(+)
MRTSAPATRVCAVRTRAASGAKSSGSCRGSEKASSRTARRRRPLREFAATGSKNRGSAGAALAPAPVRSAVGTAAGAGDPRTRASAGSRRFARTCSSAARLNGSRAFVASRLPPNPAPMRPWTSQNLPIAHSTTALLCASLARMERWAFAASLRSVLIWSCMNRSAAMSIAARCVADPPLLTKALASRSSARRSTSRADAACASRAGAPRASMTSAAPMNTSVRSSTARGGFSGEAAMMAESSAGSSLARSSPVDRDPSGTMSAMACLNSAKSDAARSAASSCVAAWS